MNAFTGTWGRRVLFGLALVVAGGIWWIGDGSPPAWILFAGSFHPVVVHFPVGLLLLAAILEVVVRSDDRFAPIRPAISVLLGIGAATAILAVGAGWILAGTGGYSEEILGWHRWLGVAVAIGAASAWLLERKIRAARRALPFAGSAYLGVLAATALALVVAGHLGGTLTHGTGYLTRYLPEPIRSVLDGSPNYGLPGEVPTPIDSARVYRDLVGPVLRDRCGSCHGAGRTEGGLRLDGPRHIREGGEDGPVVEPGRPGESALVERITLPLHHEDRMPPEGRPPLGIEHTELLRWWIEHGASFEATVADLRAEPTPTSVQTYLTRLSRPAAEVRTGIYAEEVAPPDSSVLDELASGRFRIRRLTRTDPFLRVELAESVDSVDARLVARLDDLSRQVTWIDLSGAVVTEEAVGALGGFPHLTRLYLRDSRIGESGLRALADCEFLTYVNLVGSNVSDEGLAYLASVESLESVYLWKTRVTDAGLDSLRARLDGAVINRGATFVVRDSSGSDTVRTDTVAG